MCVMFVQCLEPCIGTLQISIIIIIYPMQPLQTIYLPPPTGDDEVLRSQSQAGSLSDGGDFDDLSDSIDLMLPDEGERTGQSQPQDDAAKDIDALPFPLYSLHAAKSDALHKPCGMLPLVMYWGKRERPRVFNRQIGKDNDLSNLILIFQFQCCETLPPSCSLCLSLCVFVSLCLTHSLFVCLSVCISF